jgi:hypothetical protein
MLAIIAAYREKIFDSIGPKVRSIHSAIVEINFYVAIME